VVNHNTVITTQAGQAVTVYLLADAQSGFVFTNNILPNHGLCIFGDHGKGDGIPTLDEHAPGWTVARNVVYGPWAANYPPDTAFADALSAALTQNHLRARPLKAANVDEMSLERSLAFYKERFADASDFTFVFVGSFTVDELKPLAERYLASLPSIRRAETAVDRGIRTPAGVVERQVVKGLDPRSQVAIVFSGPMEHDQMKRLKAQAPTKAKVDPWSGVRPSAETNAKR